MLASCSQTTSALDASSAPDVRHAPDVAHAPDVSDAPDFPDAPAGSDAGLSCAPDRVRCEVDGGASCFDLRTDPRHCGACGAPCCAGQVCVLGQCVLSCPPGNTGCVLPGETCPVCVRIDVSPSHCGACNVACAAGQVCQGGLCTPAACPRVTEPPSPMGQCDGRGRIACEMWAQGIAGGRPNVTAQCVSAPAGCVRADRCDDPSDPATCRCGLDPACGPNEVCALVGPTARCQCAQL
jgi:hypothetical protein